MCGEACLAGDCVKEVGLRPWFGLRPNQIPEQSSNEGHSPYPIKPKRRGKPRLTSGGIAVKHFCAKALNDLLAEPVILSLQVLQDGLNLTAVVYVGGRFSLKRDVVHKLAATMKRYDAPIVIANRRA